MSELRYYDALKTIAKDYMTPKEIRREASRGGLTYEEFLEMAYENIQKTAQDAIRGRKRPKEQP